MEKIKLLGWIVVLKGVVFFVMNVKVILGFVVVFLRKVIKVLKFLFMFRMWFEYLISCYKSEVMNLDIY